MKIIILITLSLFFTPLFARSPAVDPVSGISIEEYTEVDPKTTKGFDFTNSKDSDLVKDSELNASTAFFLLVASILPVVVWFGVMRALPDAPTAPANETARTPLTIVQGQNNSSDDDHDDDTLPKAS